MSYAFQRVTQCLNCSRGVTSCISYVKCQAACKLSGMHEKVSTLSERCQKAITSPKHIRWHLHHLEWVRQLLPRLDCLRQCALCL
jgi:hypothetical protein